MHGHRATGCTTVETAFFQYGIPHGRKLRTGAREEFADADRGFDPSLSFFERLARAFRDAFVVEAADPVVPAPVEAAVRDATAATAHEYVDREDAGFGTVMTAFYRRVARYACTSRELAGEGGRDPGGFGGAGGDGPA